MTRTKTLTPDAILNFVTNFRRKLMTCSASARFRIFKSIGHAKLRVGDLPVDPVGEAVAGKAAYL